MIDAIKKAIRRPFAAVERTLYERRVLSPEDLRLPDFLGIGTAQGGTTWLYENLRKHPDIYIPWRKEVHYFDRNFDWRLPSYAGLFEEGDARRVGEITPGYAILAPRRIRFMRRIMPEARLILTLRNPVDRAWSAARRIFTRLSKKQFGAGFSEIDDGEFFEFFAREHEYPPLKHPPGDFAPNLKRANYGRILDNWLAVYPAEQLLTVFFEEISMDPKKALTRVFSHIGVTTDVDWTLFPSGKVVNPNPRHRMPDRFRTFLEDLYAEDIEAVQRRIGGHSLEWTRRT